MESKELAVQADPVPVTYRPAHNGSVDVMTRDGFEAAMNLAETLVASGFLPKGIDRPAKALAVILAGQELGIPPMTSLRLFRIVEGNVSMTANAMLERFKRRGGRAAWRESDATRAVLWLRAQNGDEHVETVSIEDAKAAGLVAKDNWKKYPKSMLRARCTSFGLRALGESEGMHDPDELGAVTDENGDITDDGPRARPATFARPVRSSAVRSPTKWPAPVPAEDVPDDRRVDVQVEETAPDKVTAAQIKIIHVLKKKCGFDDADWKARLTEKFGVDSSALLSMQQASTLIDAMERLTGRAESAVGDVGEYLAEKGVTNVE